MQDALRHLLSAQNRIHFLSIILQIPHYANVPNLGYQIAT